jgi:hypothetical protein
MADLRSLFENFNILPYEFISEVITPEKYGHRTTSGVRERQNAKLASSRTRWNFNVEQLVDKDRLWTSKTIVHVMVQFKYRLTNAALNRRKLNAVYYSNCMILCLLLRCHEITVYKSIFVCIFTKKKLLRIQRLRLRTLAKTKWNNVKITKKIP